MKTYVKPEVDALNLRVSEEIATGYTRVGVSDEEGYSVTTYQVDSFTTAS